MVITIDGPAGSGKSTAARKLAAALEIPYLDTGAMYRALAYLAIQENIDPSDSKQLVELAKEADLFLECGPTHVRVKANGHDVSEAIRTLAVSQVTSPIAKNQGVRDVLVEKQRKIGKVLGSFVTEGRDQGSVVFPDADVKFVIEADVNKRAQRRLVELTADGEDVDFDTVRGNLESRDANDAVQWAALLEPGAAIRIDTTYMTIPKVVERLLAHIKQITGQECPKKNLGSERNAIKLSGI